MATEYICRKWRDAVTDPPMSDWTGYVRTGDKIKILASIVNGVVYVFSPHTSRAFTVVPGDQWLDITDIPAIPRGQVQAAVNDIKGVYDVPCDNESAENYNEGMDAALRLIAAHTGITPSITEDSSVTGIEHEHEHDDHFPDATKKVEMAKVLAEKIFDWMLHLKCQSGDFLPVDVCCDFVGGARFKAGLAKVIAEVTP